MQPRNMLALALVLLSTTARAQGTPDTFLLLADPITSATAPTVRPLLTPHPSPRPLASPPATSRSRLDAGRSRAGARTGDRLWNGALIGFGTGVAAGYFLTPAEDRRYYNEAAGAYGLLGAAIGTTVDALITDSHSDRTSARRSIAFGFGIGAASGMLLVRGMSERPPAHDYVFGAFVFGAFGAGVGAAVDALAHRGDVTPGRTLRIVPVAGPGGGAVHGRVRW